MSSLRTAEEGGGRVAVARGSDTANGLIFRLLAAAHTVAPDDLATLVAQEAAKDGLRDAVVYLVDLQQQKLIPLPLRGVPPEQPVTVDGSAAGRAYWALQPVEVEDADGGHRMWVPLLDGIERLGVLGVTLDDPASEARTLVDPLASLVALLLVSKRPFNETAARLRRTKGMTLSAEVQWALLPPLTFGTEDVVVAGALEPAYDIGGDAFEYVADGSEIHMAIFDAMGHDLSAGLSAGIAVGALKYARRSGLGLTETTMAIDEALAKQFGQRRFVTGILATLDTATGVFRWVMRGHPPPLLIRGGKWIKSLHCPVAPPMGMRMRAAPVVCEEQLEPGDRLLLYSDGVVEARSPQGEFFGLKRFADFVIRQHSAGLAPPETLRRLVLAILGHQQGQLQDDATILLVEWYRHSVPAELS